MKINVKTLPNPSLITHLYERYYLRDITPDNLLSSHWKQFGANIEVCIDADGNLRSFKSYGFGDLNATDILSRIPAYFCNASYFPRVPHKKDLVYLIKQAIPNLKMINSYLSYDCFRQICSLCAIRNHLSVKERDSFNILMIGDGFGFLSSLLKSLYPSCRIILIDIGKVLLFQAVNLQIIHPRYCHSLIDDVSLPKEVPDFLYVPAECMDQIKGIKYRLSINISSMQEMNSETINSYFAYLRSHSTNDNLFYCCNRKQKRLPGGEITEFLDYPWLKEDKHLIDELCPFYRYYFSIVFPFFHRFDGLFMHRLTNLETRSGGS